MKKIFSVLIALVMALSFAVNTSAVSVEAPDERPTYSWTGKTTMKSGRHYVINKNVNITGNVILPADSTLTIKNNATLFVTKNGSLTLRGETTIKKGSTLTVTGKLYQGGGTSMNVYGTLWFGSKANAALYGQTKLMSGGVIKGEPAQVKSSYQTQFYVNSKGTLKSDKIDNEADRSGIYNMLYGFYDKSLREGNVYEALTMHAYPKKYTDYLNKVLELEGSSLEKFCEDFEKEYYAQLSDMGKNQSDIISVQLNYTKLSITDVTKKIAVEEINAYKSVFGDITKVCDVNATVLIRHKGGNDTENVTVRVAEVGGNWYIFG